MQIKSLHSPIKWEERRPILSGDAVSTAKSNERFCRYERDAFPFLK